MKQTCIKLRLSSSGLRSPVSGLRLDRLDVMNANDRPSGSCIIY